MALHRLTSVTIGVPNADETAAYYTEFGLTPQHDGWFSTRDAGRQLRIVHSPMRRLVELHVGADDADDIARVTDGLRRLGIQAARGPHSVTAVEKATRVRATVEVAPRVTQAPVRATAYNGPGRVERSGARAPGVLRTERVQPRKLGHAVLGTTDLAVTGAFFLDGLGFKLSDSIKDIGAFMRCSTDHPSGTSGAWAGTTPGRTSSGTSRTRPATSVSTTPTWTASPTTSSGPRRHFRAPGACSTGARPHRRPFSPPTTSPRS